MLHLVALLFGAWFLVLTIPLHLIYATLAKRNTPADDGAQVRCPDCMELVRFDARKCKHCGAALTPAAAPPPEPPEQRHGLAIAIVTLVVMILLARMIS